jgi:hypothetical protein
MEMAGSDESQENGPENSRLTAVDMQVTSANLSLAVEPCVHVALLWQLQPTMLPQPLGRDLVHQEESRRRVVQALRQQEVLPSFQRVERVHLRPHAWGIVGVVKPEVKHPLTAMLGGDGVDANRTIITKPRAKLVPDHLRGIPSVGGSA